MDVLTPAGQLFGREHDLVRIEAFIAGTDTGGGALLVFGEPGVGKTALLDAAAASAAAAGFRVLRAAGVEFEADLPFSGLHQLLLSLHEESSGLSREHRETLNTALGFGEGPAPGRLVVCHAMLTVLRRAAGPASWAPHGPARAVSSSTPGCPNSICGRWATTRPASCSGSGFRS